MSYATSPESLPLWMVGPALRRALQKQYVNTPRMLPPRLVSEAVW